MLNLANKSLFFIIALLLLILSSHNLYAVDKKAFDFSLKNFDGQTVTLQDLRGKVVVLTFSYAFCSVRCPIITGRLSALDELLKVYQDVVYLHVSVDPDMDTPENRRKYFNLYGIDAVMDNRWMFVSGPKHELSKLWEFYGINIEKIESKYIPEGYYINYTQKIIIIRKNGFIAHNTDFYFSEDKLAKIIRSIR
jgi:cytochrome oxidase Cu insertion factor (SCO1/SenC/PrrC family)